MTMLFVADVGNSRIKWGRCDAARVLEAASLPLDDPNAWQEQLRRWHQPADAGGSPWVVTGVNPSSMERLADWLAAREQAVHRLNGYRDLPLQVAVEYPERVGIDRLLNAVAGGSRNRAGPAILVDAGSAVTVDWLDEKNVFRGGAIFPGLRLMAGALHQYTAKLPMIEVPRSVPKVPGPSTESAIAAGIHAAVVGGISYLVGQVADLPESLGTSATCPTPVVYLTGGDSALLARSLEPTMKRLQLEMELWPFMTLEGIRLSAARFL